MGTFRPYRNGSGTVWDNDQSLLMTMRKPISGGLGTSDHDGFVHGAGIHMELLGCNNHQVLLGIICTAGNSPTYICINTINKQFMRPNKPFNNVFGIAVAVAVTCALSPKTFPPFTKSFRADICWSGEIAFLESFTHLESFTQLITQK